MNGLLVTTEPFEVYDGFPAEARYAGMTADGRGIVALDGVDPRAMQFGGTFYSEVEDPADPRWEELIRRPTRGPKRKVGDGNEAFIITRLDSPGTRTMLELGDYRAFGLYEHAGVTFVVVETEKWSVVHGLAPEFVWVIEEWQDRRVDALV